MNQNPSPSEKIVDKKEVNNKSIRSFYYNTRSRTEKTRKANLLNGGVNGDGLFNLDGLPTRTNQKASNEVHPNGMRDTAFTSSDHSVEEDEENAINRLKTFKPRKKKVNGFKNKKTKPLDDKNKAFGIIQIVQNLEPPPNRIATTVINNLEGISGQVVESEAEGQPEHSEKLQISGHVEINEVIHGIENSYIDEEMASPEEVEAFHLPEDQHAPVERLNDLFNNVSDMTSLKNDLKGLLSPLKESFGFLKEKVLKLEKVVDYNSVNT